MQHAVPKKRFEIIDALRGFALAGIVIVHADDKRQDLSGRFLRRLVLLFAVGYPHHLFYRGDILTIYRIMGVFLIPFTSFKVVPAPFYFTDGGLASWESSGIYIPSGSHCSL